MGNMAQIIWLLENIFERTHTHTLILVHHDLPLLQYGFTTHKCWCISSLFFKKQWSGEMSGRTGTEAWIDPQDGARPTSVTEHSVHDLFTTKHRVAADRGCCAFAERLEGVLMTELFCWQSPPALLQADLQSETSARTTTSLMWEQHQGITRLMKSVRARAFLHGRLH